MAERRGPSDGGRFKRATPSGNHKKKKPAGEAPKRIDTFKGETKCTPEMIEQIVRLIQAGNYAEVAARASGIAVSTFYEWLTRGGRGEQPYAQLAEAVEKAAAQSEARDVAVIGRAAEKQWQAAAWRLERKNHKRWGRKDGLELTGDAQKPIAVVSVLKFGDEEIEF